MVEKQSYGAMGVSVGIAVGAPVGVEEAASVGEGVSVFPGVGVAGARVAVGEFTPTGTVGVAVNGTEVFVGVAVGNPVEVAVAI